MAYRSSLSTYWASSRLHATNLHIEGGPCSNVTITRHCHSCSTALKNPRVRAKLLPNMRPPFPLRPSFYGEVSQHLTQPFCANSLYQDHDKSRCSRWRPDNFFFQVSKIIGAASEADWSFALSSNLAQPSLEPSLR
jgi:hypothetical protein